MHDRYSLSMRVFHWVMAILILTLIGVGLWMSDLPKDYPDRMFVYNMHKSFGLIALFLVAIRIVNRAGSSIPELPYQIKKSDENLGHLVHYSLYLLMFLMPISGYMMSALAGYPVYLFSFEVPSMFHVHKELATDFWLMHKYCAYGLITLLVLHVVGSLKHLFIDKVNIFNRMW